MIRKDEEHAHAAAPAPSRMQLLDVWRVRLHALLNGSDNNGDDDQVLSARIALDRALAMATSTFVNADIASHRLALDLQLAWNAHRAAVAAAAAATAIAHETEMIPTAHVDWCFTVHHYVVGRSDPAAAAAAIPPRVPRTIASPPSIAQACEFALAAQLHARGSSPSHDNLSRAVLAITTSTSSTSNTRRQPAAAAAPFFVPLLAHPRSWTSASSAELWINLLDRHLDPLDPQHGPLVLPDAPMWAHTLPTTTTTTTTAPASAIASTTSALLALLHAPTVDSKDDVAHAWLRRQPIFSDATAPQHALGPLGPLLTHVLATVQLHLTHHRKLQHMRTLAREPSASSTASSTRHGQWSTTAPLSLVPLASLQRTIVWLLRHAGEHQKDLRARVVRVAQRLCADADSLRRSETPSTALAASMYVHAHADGTKQRAIPPPHPAELFERYISHFRRARLATLRHQHPVLDSDVSTLLLTETLELERAIADNAPRASA